jgi:hypothetical protein
MVVVVYERSRFYTLVLVYKRYAPLNFLTSERERSFCTII